MIVLFDFIATYNNIGWFVRMYHVHVVPFRWRWENKIRRNKKDENNRTTLIGMRYEFKLKQLKLNSNLKPYSVRNTRERWKIQYIVVLTNKTFICSAFCILFQLFPFEYGKLNEWMICLVMIDDD